MSACYLQYVSVRDFLHKSDCTQVSLIEVVSITDYVKHMAEFIV
jgi:hypothetical protein